MAGIRKFFAARRPLRLELQEDGLKLNVLFVLNRKAKASKHGETVADIALSGMQQTWTVKKSLTPELEQAFLAFIERRHQENLPAAKAFLKARHRLAKEQSDALQKEAEKFRIVEQALSLPIATNLRQKVERKSETCDPTLPMDFSYEVIEPVLASPTLTLIMQILRFKRRPIRLYLRPLALFPSHVGSPLWRRFWGLFRYGHLEAVGYNWSLGSPGYMVVNSSLTKHSLQRVAAHELGHILGLGDAYGAFYRFYDAYPGSENFLMHANGPLSDLEFRMFLKAHTVNRAQFFKRRFSWQKMKEGFKTERAYYKRKIKALSERKGKTR